MMVLDTVHSSGVGRMHGGMKIARNFQAAPDAKFLLTPDMVVVEKKKDSGVESPHSRPGLVIRRRIMVSHGDEVVAGPPTPALLSRRPLTAHENSPKQQTSDIARSATTTTAQDQSPRAMTKPTKTLRLFDLNKLPSVQETILSPGSPTVESADSATTDHHAAMATKSDALDFSSSPEMKLSKGGEGRGLAVDLGVLAPLPAAIKQQFAVRKPQEAHAVEHITVPTPTRKRLRKLSDYADRGTTDSMAKLWTTSGEGDGCNNLDDVTKTVAPSQADSQVRCRHPDVDDEVFSAVAALLMLSSSAERRSELQSEASTDLAAAASDTEEPCRSSGSGSSVLLRPRNKQRYRSVAEIMATTPIVKRKSVGS